jgi:hypothetical protein
MMAFFINVTAPCPEECVVAFDNHGLAFSLLFTIYSAKQFL